MKGQFYEDAQQTLKLGTVVPPAPHDGPHSTTTMTKRQQRAIIRTAGKGVQIPGLALPLKK